MLRLFRRIIPGRVAALLASEFILIYLCYVAAAFAFLRPDAQGFLVDDNGWLRILIVTTCLIVGVYFHDLYSNFRVRTQDLVQHAVVVAGSIQPRRICRRLAPRAAARLSRVGRQAPEFGRSHAGDADAVVDAQDVLASLQFL